MTENKEYPDYNINLDVGTEIESSIKIKTLKYHPYGLEGFRKQLIEHIDEWQSKGFAWQGYDQLTHAWRTPWDTHIRYKELMSPILSTVMAIVNDRSPDPDWFMQDCWISEYTQNSGANKHNHHDDSLGYSFCYYVKIPDIGPGFTLCDDVNMMNIQINVAEGDLLIFRHPMMHQVFPALDRRIIISGNVYQVTSFDHIIQNMYLNEKFASSVHEQYIGLPRNNKIDVDNWSLPVVKQMYGIETNGGY